MTVDPPPDLGRSWWLREALGDPEFADPACPALSRDATADVVILGGGYTGMWTAFHLKERDPAIDVAILEQDICGGGPSGRNGGFVNAWWTSVPEMARRFGDADAVELAMAASRSVEAIGRFCEREHVDAWFSGAGEMTVATNPTHDGSWSGLLQETARLGVDGVFTELSADDVRARCQSPTFGAGVFESDAATVQPARLARGLRRVLLERGVRIFEQTPVRRFGSGRPVVAETPGGTMRAEEAIIAVGAWGAGWRRFRRALAVRGSYIVLTAPAPDRLRDIGWTGGEAVRDLRSSLHYLRTTPDGRIAFGAAGLQPGLARSIGPRFAYDPPSLRTAIEDLRRMFPSFRDVPIVAGWGGPIDVAGLYLPFFGTGPSGNVHHGLGFTGNGVAPSHLGGQILAALASHADDGFTRLALVRREPLRFPPASVLLPGMLAVNRAIHARDDALDAGRLPSRIADLLAHIPRRLGYNLGPR
jgi:glycine/D-amino acid oxidase-like deaminating enzyme